MHSNQIKIAYIGGGSRNWAWCFMSDLAAEKEISGLVSLYDMDYEAAQVNESIGNRIEGSRFKYKAEKNIGDALNGADFVVISILPGTFEEMRSDVHFPEQYGIFQSVGDTTGPGGIIRAMRTIPLFAEIAQAVEKYSPNAWVINYTNPMAMCTDALYRVFPKIKAFGCCHEVFKTQEMLGFALKEEKGIEGIKRHDVKINVIGINHFTWITRATYKEYDLFPVYARFVERHLKEGVEFDLEQNETPDNRMFSCLNLVKFDLFRHTGYIAAAGDRHLAEFCPGYWYLKDPSTVKDWGFGLTPVNHRVKRLGEKLARSKALASGEEKFTIFETGEEGVMQMKAIMGLGDFVTNVNLPNRGQITNMPLGHVVETNAYFTSGEVNPVMAGKLPEIPHAMTMRVSDNYRVVVDSCLNRDLEGCFKAFANDPLVTIAPSKAHELFEKMVANTKKYLTSYGKL